MAQKPNELINALTYAIESYPEIGRTKLMKFVFFVDLVYYHQHKSTLLEDDYTRQKWGPVPDRAFCITDSSNAAFAVTEEQLTPEKRKYVFSPQRPSVMANFSRQELELMDAVISILKKMTADEASDSTHKFKLWERLETGDKIPISLFELDEYEQDQMMSLFAYDDALELGNEGAAIFLETRDVEIGCS